MWATYGLTHVDVNRDAFRESGAADAILAFQTLHANSTRLHAALTTEANWLDVHPRVRLSVSHELGQTRRTTTASLTALPDTPFDVSLNPEERTWIQANLSLPYRPAAGVEMALQTGAVLNDRTGGQMIGLTVRFDW